MIDFVVIIPARFFSKRFPGKILSNICGKPMITYVVHQALNSGASKVIVATDDIKVVKVIKSEYFSSVEVCLTNIYHNSGMERLAEVVKKYKFSDNQIIVHLQGDEPCINSSMIHQIVNSLHSLCTDNCVTSMATLATPLFLSQEISDKNIVKVVTDVHNHALYFSRSIIPWYSKYNNNYTLSHIKNEEIFMRHIGIYAYYASFLHNYITWPESKLEKYEGLEQLRVLWHGGTIFVSIVHDASNVISVNTPKDLYDVNQLFKR